MAFPVSRFLETSPTLLAEPSLQRPDERAAPLGAHSHALRWCQTVDLALDGEQGIDALNALAGDRRLIDPGQAR